MPTPVAVRTKRKGELFIPSAGKKVRQILERDDIFYDTEEFATGALTAGESVTFWRNTDNKENLHNNVGDKHIPSHFEMTLTHVGLLIHQLNSTTLVTDADVIRLAYSCFTFFKLGTQEVRQGPAWSWQSGYGVTGQTNRNNTGIVSVGMVSAASAPRLMKDQEVDSDDDLVGKMEAQAITWQTATTLPTLDSAVGVSQIIRGIVRKPLGA